MKPITPELIGAPGTLDVNDIDIEKLDAEFSRMNDPAEIIASADETFGDSLVAAATFNRTSAILLDYACRVIDGLVVVNIVHGHETKETLEQAKICEEVFDIDLQKEFAEYEEVPEEGTPEFADFQHRTKIEPMQNFINRQEPRPKAILFGPMRWQGPERAKKRFAKRQGSIIAINPLLDVSEKYVEEFFPRTGHKENTNHYDPAKGKKQKLECSLLQTEFADPAKA